MLLWEGVGVKVGPAGGPASAPGIPRVLASLARAPFAGSERGRTWMDVRGPLPRLPARASPARFAPRDSRPLALKRRGRWIPACAGMTVGAWRKEVRNDGMD